MRPCCTGRDGVRFPTTNNGKHARGRYPGSFFCEMCHLRLVACERIHKMIKVEVSNSHFTHTARRYHSLMNEALRVIAKHQGLILDELTYDGASIVLDGVYIEVLSVHGTTRLVVESEGRVYKIGYYGPEINMDEWKIWQDVKDTPLGRFFVPALDYYEGILEMEYAPSSEEADVVTARQVRLAFDTLTVQHTFEDNKCLARCDDWEFNLSEDGRFLDYASFYGKPAYYITPNDSVNF